MLRGTSKRATKLSVVRPLRVRQLTTQAPPAKPRAKRARTSADLEAPPKRKKSTPVVDVPKESGETEKKSAKKKSEKKVEFVPPTDRIRCSWCLGSAAYVHYHDTEWGVPVRDDRKLFEFLVLEGAQAGLSWATILNKREDYRAAFHDFDANLCARMTDAELEVILAQSNVVKHRLKVWSVRSNALCVQSITKEFGSLTKYLWGFVKSLSPYDPDTPRPTSPESEAMSKDLKKRGLRYVGPTIMYAFMQAVGMVNDHSSTCFKRGVKSKAKKT